MATLTVTRILADIAAAFTVQAPLLNRVGSDFTAEPLKRGQTAMAHIAKLPTVADYDSETGYANGATESNTLVEDVPILIDQHKHVPVKVSYLMSLADDKLTYQKAIQNAAMVLAKYVVDDGLAKVLAANFSEKTTEIIADTDRDTFSKMRKDMNKKGAAPTGRTAIVDSDVFEALDADPRIASREYHGQQIEGSAIGRLINVAGFEEILEYPDFPDNGENLAGFGMDQRAMMIKTGIPDDVEQIREGVGAPAIAKFELITDPDTGITLLGIYWQVPGTFHIFMTVTLLWGWVIGRQGGDAGDKNDFAGHRLVTA